MGLPCHPALHTVGEGTPPGVTEQCAKLRATSVPYLRFLPHHALKTPRVKNLQRVDLMGSVSIRNLKTKHLVFANATLSARPGCDLTSFSLC